MNQALAPATQQTGIPAKPALNQGEYLRLMEEASGRYDSALYELRANAITQVLYTHSYQNHAFSKSMGAPVDLRDQGYGSNQIFNVMLPVVQQQKAMLLARSPKRDAYAITRDEADIEAARYVLDLLKWADVEHRIDEVADEASTHFSEVGNFIFFVGWDPTAGRSWELPNGKSLFEGGPVFRCDSMFEWNFHPDARNFRESPYCYRVSYVSRDWAIEHFPEYADQMPEDIAVSSASAPVFQRMLLNLGPSGSLRSNGEGQRAPRKEQYVEFHELYFRSSPKRPTGLMMFAIGEGGRAKVIVHNGENPYAERKSGRRTLPVVHAKQISRVGSLWGEALTQHMIPIQNYINCFEEIIEENAELIGNPFGYYWQDGIAPETWNNDIGNLVPIAPGSNPPGWMEPPQLPAMVMQAPVRAMQYMNNLCQPIGPLQQEQEANVSSGVQQAIVNEGKEFRVGPMMKAWELAWDAAWNLYVDNWANFAMLPKKIGAVGADGGWRETYFTGALASKNFVVRIEPNSSIPKSKQAEVGTFIELSKTPPFQAALMTNPALMKQFLEDIGKGDMTRTEKNPYIHKDKARRNIAAVRMGQMKMVDPMLDNIMDHIEIYQEYMNSPEYELAVTQDPMFDVRMRLMLQSFLQLQVQMAQMAQAQMAQAQGNAEQTKKNDAGGGPPQAQGAVGAAKGGDGGFPRAHQGFGRAPTTVGSNGGRPPGNSA